ncbi:uncharacterized protein CC84DRAFT_1253768 [Paraphaeosphaeria sporulosa]|uniref:Uncharacterized protein n=1 Tax=Paraphaeosphaeria sporulosa TaxID=1460663 RepID=A0A177CVM4_9PLEO|nr:uncharacterized protein CC84DRAFT_1253768 [Paraphaeosphaeria sporulosa]OAG11271.1 hypothetical protein CC84DRAFT_1253768 [Paraphaeosphaeria sporulosa]
MSSRLLTALKSMMFTGVILLPTAFPHAVQDLVDLKTVIDATAATIDAAPNNSSWGFFSPASPAGSLGTADLIANISTTILRAKYLLNVDRTAWTTIPDNTTALNNTANPTPTEIRQASTPTPPPSSNISLDAPYVDYVSSIPSLSNALVDLGRAWHKELNSPVSEAIGALQEAITQFSTSMLEGDLLNSTSILRTIRASSSLESAQVAWSRVLNLPGAAGTKKKRGEVEVKRPPLPDGQFYTHKDLWGRGSGAVPRQAKVENDDSSKASTVEATWSEWRIEKIARRFVA